MNQPPQPVAPTLYAQGVPQGTPPVPQSLPPGGIIYGPYPAKAPVVRRYSLLVVVLLTAVSILIYANAQALLWPLFFVNWSLWFPWLLFAGAAGPFIIGVVLSLVIAGAIFLYMLGFRVLAAFMVFPASIVSLFIGGGFIVGLILGVLTGILMIINRRP